VGLGLSAGDTVKAKLDVNGNVKVRGGMCVLGNDTVGLKLLVEDSVTLKKTLQVGGNTTLQQALTVSGNTTLNSPTNVNSTLTVSGNISASGSTVTANTFVGYGITPVGGIMMWSGSTADFDASGNGKTNTKMDGWALCNSANGTPDLRGRFIVGYNPYDGDYNSTGKTGGETRHVLSVNEMPSHSHQYETRGVGKNNDWNAGTGYESFPANPKGTTYSTGGGGSHENRPPYYVLAFIMRVK
jgi:cytoskeletal protein CcmA (bactofilin family)